jgi:hypothetical protein
MRHRFNLDEPDDDLCLCPACGVLVEHVRDLVQLPDEGDRVCIDCAILADDEDRSQTEYHCTAVG